MYSTMTEIAWHILDDKMHLSFFTVFEQVIVIVMLSKLHPQAEKAVIV